MIENPKFKSLKIRPDFLKKLSSLHKLATNISRPSLDFNHLVDYLMDISSSFSSLHPNESRLLVAHCIFWLTTDEMSVREKAFGLIEEYIASV